MWRGRLIAAGIVLLLGGGGYVAWRLTHPPRSDREQINRLLERIECGVETKRPRMIVSAISDDYRDDSGLTKRDLHRLSLELLRTRGTPQVIIEEIKVVIRGARADVRLAGEAAIYERGRKTDQYSATVNLHLCKRHGRWLITSTSGWQGKVAEEVE
jgi:hypothetical protein